MTRCRRRRRDVKGGVGLLDVIPDDTGIRPILLQGVPKLGVWRQITDVDKPGVTRLLTGVDLLQCEIGQNIGLIFGLVIFVVGVDHAVVVDRKPKVSTRGRVDQRTEVVPTRRYLGGVLHAVAVEILSNVRRVVARFLEPSRKRRLPLGEPSESSGGQRVPQHPVVVGVLA